MGPTKERAIVFADVRGSTGLYLQLGNSQAAATIVQCLTELAEIVRQGQGRVVKTLGDGLMAVFDGAEAAVDAATLMHERIEAMGAGGSANILRTAVVRLKIAIAWGETVEAAGDCYGDAVNVAARLLDLAGDNETLTTALVLPQLPSDQLDRFRSIDKLHLRGRKEPVAVLRMEPRRFADTLSTVILESATSAEQPDGIRLNWLTTDRVFAVHNMPITLGRSPQASFCVSDSRVSRTHARIESHSGHLYLSDLSYNGTHIRFDHEGQILTLRRGTCTLHGSGIICLGATPDDPTATQIRFDVLSLSETRKPA